MKFSHAEQTVVDPHTIWGFWMDVNTWPMWNEHLTYTDFAGTFEKGAIGIIKPKKGPKLTFEIIAYEYLRYCSFRMKVPFGAIIINKHLSHAKGTIYTHEVICKGLASLLYANNLKKNTKSAMEKLKEIAESREK